jgi:ribonuclease D
MSEIMKSDFTVWHTVRPLTQDMLDYAAQDVVYLPLVFECMRRYFLIPYQDKFYNPNGDL